MNQIFNNKQIGILLFGLLIGLIFVGNSFGATIVLNPVEDTFIDEIGPTNVHGTENNLVARRGPSWALNPLIKFKKLVIKTLCFPQAV